MRSNSLTPALFLILSVFFTAGHAQQRASLSEIKNSLVCQCDCNMTLEACQGSMACQTAEQLTAEAMRYMDQGMDRQAVLATFINKYGEQILAAPTKKGFNLTAWILPFAAILLAGYGITRAIRRWVRQPTRYASSGVTDGKKEKPERSPYDDQLDEALRYLD